MIYRNLLLFLSFFALGYPGLAQHPNVLLIMTDDQGIGDLGARGNQAIRTPVLDALAAESARFRHFYVSPVCAPTRSSLMTGRWTLRTGVFDTYNGGAIMAADETTLAEILAAGGYRTGIFGKWHLGDNYPSRAADQGFEESLVHLGGGVGQPGDFPNYPRFDSAYFDPVLWHNGRPVKTKGYCSDVYTDAALGFMAETDERPFFAYLAFNAPHTPLQVPQEYYDSYAGLDSVPGQEGLLQRGLGEDQLQDQEGLRSLYGMVTNIDDNVGRLLEKLDQLGISQNTLVIFLTDNGPQQYRFTQGLRGRKGTVFEGGIQVPCYFRWPGRLAPDRVVNGYAAHIDILPTVLGLAGIPAPDSLQLDGRNLALDLQGLRHEMPEKTLFFQWQRGFPEPYKNIAVRRRPFKLVGHPEIASGLALYNLEEDPGEYRDIRASHPDTFQELKTAFDQWLEEMTQTRAGRKPAICLGCPQEDPVAFNRNDARGSPGIWTQDAVYGYWDVRVARSGLYRARVHFFEPLGQSGRLLLRLGPIQRTLYNEDPGKSVLELDDLPLLEGSFMLEAWYAGRDAPPGQAFTHFPFFVEIEAQ